MENHVWLVYVWDDKTPKIVMAVHETEAGALDYVKRLRDYFPKKETLIERRVLWP